MDDLRRDMVGGNASTEALEKFMGMSGAFDPFGMVAASMMFPSFILNWYSTAVEMNPLFQFARLASKNSLDMFLVAQRAQAGLQRKEIRVADGLTYVYLEGGAGEPLLLLHSFGAGKDTFVSVASCLTANCRVIIPDQIGFGESSQPADTDYSLRAQAERVRAFLDALDISRVHLGGCSMGGHIAATYAAMFPEDVRTLWLLDPTGVWSAPESIMQTVLKETGRNPLFVERVEDLPGALRMLMSNPPPYIPRAMLSAFAEPYLKNPALGELVLREIGADSIEERVRGLETPTLIVWGNEDKIVHVDGSKILSALMPRSQVIIMPQTGHMPIVENPLRCAQDYLRFRKQLDTTKDT